MAIVKMKHLRLAAMQSDREALLRLLQGWAAWRSKSRRWTGAIRRGRAEEPGQRGALRRPGGEKRSPARPGGAQALRKGEGGLLSPRPVVSSQQFFEEQAYRSALETARAINDGGAGAGGAEGGAGQAGCPAGLPGTVDPPGAPLTRPPPGRWRCSSARYWRRPPSPSWRGRCRQ